MHACWILLFKVIRLIYGNSVKNYSFTNFILLRNFRPLDCSYMTNLTVGKILNLYTTSIALSNMRFKYIPHSLLFFSIFFFKPYNTGAIHPYIRSNTMSVKVIEYNEKKRKEQLLLTIAILT